MARSRLIGRAFARLTHVTSGKNGLSGEGADFILDCARATNLPMPGFLGAQGFAGDHVREAVRPGHQYRKRPYNLFQPPSLQSLWLLQKSNLTDAAEIL
jgi:hypothetical protein